MRVETTRSTIHPMAPPNVAVAKGSRSSVGPAHSRSSPACAYLPQRRGQALGELAAGEHRKHSQLDQAGNADANEDGYQAPDGIHHLLPILRPAVGRGLELSGRTSAHNNSHAA